MNEMQNETALSLLRTLNGYRSQEEGIFAHLVADILDDKSISLDTVRYMRANGASLGPLFRETILRGQGSLNVTELDFIFKEIFSGSVRGHSFNVESYDGSGAQNRVIDHSLTIYNSSINFVGEAAMVKYT